MIKLGDITAQKMMLGSTPVQNVMLGTEQVWALAPPYLTVTPEAILTPKTEGVFTIQIDSNTNWTMQTGCTWMLPRILQGTGNATVNVRYSANTGEERSSAVRVLANDIAKYVEVTQDTSLSRISVTPTSLRFGALLFMPIPFNLKSNTRWNVVNNSSWITIDPMSGDGDIQGTVTVTTNKGGTRKYTVTFETADKSATATIHVEQDLNGNITPPIRPDI